MLAETLGKLAIWLCQKLDKMASLLPILTFHDVDNRSSVISFSPNLFQRGMAKLYERGYHTLKLVEAVDFLRRGAPFPDRSFVITFDDGSQSVYENAFPIIRHFGMSATVFLTVGNREVATCGDRLPSVDDRIMLSWQEIREMQHSGIDFGAHTITHRDLTSLSIEQIEIEICDGKARIEETLQYRVDCFAYPYGRFDGRTRKVVEQNFICACSDFLGLTTMSSDLYALERVDAYYLHSDLLFSIMLTKLFPSYIKTRSIPRRLWRSLQSISRDRSTDPRNS